MNKKYDNFLQMVSINISKLKILNLTLQQKRNMQALKVHLYFTDQVALIKN